jgi:hypothetical protein
MRTAIDTSVLVAIFSGESTCQAWMQRLIECRREGQLVICEIVYAELARGFDSTAALDHSLESLGVVFEGIARIAAFRAGKAFAEYRRRGGPRTNLIPDFMVAAHAAEQANRLAAEDRGYYCEYFSGLQVIGR